MPDSGPIRTYKEVIDYFETICNSHMAVKQFQTGQISDIDVQTESLTPTQYPLVFMVYRNGEIDGGGKTSFDFTLMVCDIAKDRTNLEVNRLSQNHDILQDIIAKIKLTSWKEVEMAIDTPIITTPFVERFNNRLSGWAAEITVTVKAPLNLCFAAFN